MQDAGIAHAGMTHVLVVDDDDRLRTLLKNYLIKNGFCVTAVASAKLVRSAISEFNFDLLVLDVMMPEEDGVAFLNSIRRFTQVPVLFLTAMSEAEDRIRGLETGADDYLTKPFEPKELVLRIEAILRRAVKTRSPENYDKIMIGDYNFDLDQGKLTNQAGEIIHFTGSELTLMMTLAKRAGQVISRAELAHIAKIQGGDRSVDVQIARLRRKIGDNAKSPRYICTIHGQGYVFRK